MLASVLLLASTVGIIKSLIFFIFMFAGILMILIVLLQEPKGGGLSGAFGGVGAETFGVQTGGVNKVTSYLAAIFLGLALVYASLREPEPDAPSALPLATPSEDGAAPSDDGASGGADETGTDAQTPPVEDGTKK